MSAQGYESGPATNICCPSKSILPTAIAWTFVFFVLGVLIAIMVPFSPGFGTIEGFDVISLSTTPIYQWLKDHPANIRHTTGFIIAPFYGLIFFYVSACISQNNGWMLLDSVIGWLLAFLSCLLIGTPINPQRIDYWSNSISPLEYFLVDNTVNMHAAVGFICSKGLVESHGADSLLQFTLFLFNVILDLFTVVTKNSSSQAVLIGLLVGMASTIIRQKVGELVTRCKSRMVANGGCRCCCILIPFWTNSSERRPLDPKNASTDLDINNPSPRSEYIDHEGIDLELELKL